MPNIVFSLFNFLRKFLRNSLRLKYTFNSSFNKKEIASKTKDNVFITPHFEKKNTHTHKQSNIRLLPKWRLDHSTRCQRHRPSCRLTHRCQHRSCCSVQCSTSSFLENSNVMSQMLSGFTGNQKNLLSSLSYSKKKMAWQLTTCTMLLKLSYVLESTPILNVLGEHIPTFYLCSCVQIFYFVLSVK